MTVAEALTATRERLQAAGIDSPAADAKLMLGQLLGLSGSELLLERHRPLSPEQTATLEGWLKRRTRREPLQHILGVAHFYGLELRVAPEVLIPRPETERLVELGLESLRGIPNPKVLDVGTGSGAIALAAKHERPDAEVLATDSSSEALKIARENAERLQLRVRFILSDLLEHEGVSAFARGADLLIANPPYLPESDILRVSPEVQADPPEALFSGHDGLEHFRRLEQAAFSLLKPGAVMLVELDPRSVRRALEASGMWADKRLLEDLTGRVRFVRLER